MNEKTKTGFMTIIGGFFKGAVPRFFPNACVIGAMWLLKGFGVSGKYIKRNKEANKQLLETNQNFYVPNQYVENQAHWKSVKFGKKCNMSYAGCEIFSVYNTMVALGEKPDAEKLVELIGYFEKKGAMLNGMFGVVPSALTNYFKKNGYHVSKVCGKAEKKLEALFAEFPVVIVTAYNDARDITKQVHTICITKDEQGRFVLHNAYKRDGAGQFTASVPFDTVQEAIKGISKGNAKLLYAIGVRKER